MAMNEKVLLTWRGGKDSALTPYELIRRNDCEIVSLRTTELAHALLELGFKAIIYLC